jgi:HD-like signal output (HDOD) protein
MSAQPDFARLGAGLTGRVPASVTEWAACFDASGLPVLRSSALAIEELRANEDAVDAHLLGETLADDPLFTLKVLAHVAQLRRGREGTDAETLTAALVMLGIPPFFRHFGPQASVEEHLAGQPQALAGLQAVLDRSHRAARFGLAFAVHRMDHDATVIREAALLHDFAELLLWLHAPALALEIQHRQATDPQLRSATVQRELLNVELPQLQHALMLKWRLPLLLVDIADDQRQSISIQARNVLLAIRLARHTALNWDNPALGDDVRDIAALLNMATEPTLALLRDLDDQDQG